MTTEALDQKIKEAEDEHEGAVTQINNWTTKAVGLASRIEALREIRAAMDTPDDDGTHGA